MELDQIWDQVLGQLEMQMTQATFDSWVKDTTLIDRKNGVYRVATNGNFAREWLEGRLFTTVQRAVADVVGDDKPEIQFVVENGQQANGNKTNGKTAEIPIRIRDRRKGKRFFIDRELIFDGFGAIIGPFGIAVYNVLSAHSDNQGQDSHLYYSTIAKLAGMSRRKAIYAVTDLETHCLIEVNRYGDGQRANEFYLLDVTEWRL